MSNFRKWLKRIFITLSLIIIAPPLIFIIALFIADYPWPFICKKSIEGVKFVCDRCNVVTFSECVSEHFPVGSGAENLDRYLRALDFSPFDHKDDILLYRWKQHWYSTIVSVTLNDNKSKIVKLNVREYWSGP